MANDKIYPIDMGVKDILLQNEGGGGMIMNNQFIGIVGNMLPNQKKLLDEQDNIKGTNIQTDKFSSNIIITNATSNPIAVGDLASKNFDSLDQSIGADQVVAPTVNNNCGGEGLLNYEFQEIAKNIAAFRELWRPRIDNTKKSVEPTTKPKKGIIDSKYQNEKVKTEQQLKDLLIDQPIIDIIKSKITLDGSNFFNVFNYQKDNYILSNTIKMSYTDRWIHDEDTDKYSLGKVKDKIKYFKNNNGTNKFESRSIFDIQTLPSGLRSLIYASRLTLMHDNDWPAVLLVAIGPEELNILTGLGITKAQAFNDNNTDNAKALKKALSDDEIYKKFFEQYDDIINAYNDDKTKFLNTLYKIIKEEFEKESAYWIKKGEESQWYYDNIDKGYGFTLLDIGLSIALKYVDCPDEYEVISNVPTTPTPSVAVTTTVTPPPPTKSEEEEGIYNAEFLPASDDPGADLFDSAYGDTCYNAVEASKKDISNKRFDAKDLVIFNPVGGLPPYFSNIDVVKELNTYIEFSSKARKDYDNGVINPNTILDLLRIGKGASIKIQVNVSRTGHSCNTTSGNLSRHMKGFGLDLGGFYDLTGAIAAPNKFIESSASSASAVPANFKAIADRFVSTAIQLDGASRSEKGNTRGILWYFNDDSRGGNHFNHVHYSNSDPYPGWSSKMIPASFKCNCAKVKASGLTAENCK